MITYSYAPKSDLLKSGMFYYSILEQNDMEHTVWSLHRSMLFIPYLLYFLIVKKSIRTLEKENDGTMVTRKFHLVAAKKGDL
jgi:hypothetical protein